MLNGYTISGTHSFSQDFSTLPPLKEDQEVVPYDIESLFTNIPVKLDIKYIFSNSFLLSVISI